MATITVKGIGEVKKELEDLNKVFIRIRMSADVKSEGLYSLDGVVWTPYKPTWKNINPPDVEIIDGITIDVLPELHE